MTHPKVRGLYPITISFITHYVRFENSSNFDFDYMQLGSVLEKVENSKSLMLESPKWSWEVPIAVEQSFQFETSY